MTVCIPTHARPDRIAACCEALAAQTLPQSDFQTLVGIDGHDQGETAAIAKVLPSATVIPGPHAGPASTRNRILAHAKAEITLLLNDDVEPAPDCLERHIQAHASRDKPAMVLGSAPWKIHEPDRLFDRLIRETSMIFFYDRMIPAANPSAATDPDHDWGYRHAWTLNFSFPTEFATMTGGFDDRLPKACFEDLEFAWRIQKRTAAPVLYRPDAVVLHDHRYEPTGYLQREHTLGAQAFHLASTHPDFARDVFRRDLASREQLDRELIAWEEHTQTAEQIEPTFRALADTPASAIDDAHAQTLIPLIYQHHLPLKRWYWRSGLLEAAGLIESRQQTTTDHATSELPASLPFPRSA